MAEGAGIFWNPRHGRGGYEPAHGDVLYGTLRDRLDPGEETSNGCSSLDDVERDDRHVAFFTSYYLFRQLGVLAFEGKEGFGGSQVLYDYVFIPILTVHIILVILGLVMAIYMIVLGFRAQQVIDGVRSL